MAIFFEKNVHLHLFFCPTKGESRSGRATTAIKDGHEYIYAPISIDRFF